MDWIKKNVLFVAGLAVAALLLAGSVFYLMDGSAAKEGAEAGLSEKNQQLDALVKREVYPNRENVEKAKAEQARVAGFISAAKQKLTRAESVTNLDNAAFKSLLETTILSLERQAAEGGVKLPDDKFGFTFGEQRKQLQLPSAALAPLAAELADIQQICELLFAAKVHSIIGLKRPGVVTNEGFGNSEILSLKPVTNDVARAVSLRYEVSFQSFSSELAEVIDQLKFADDFYIVKSINVEPAGSATAVDPALTAQPTMMGPGGMGMDPALASRYGFGARGGRYGAAAPQFRPAVTQPVRPNEPVLDEKPLKVTMGIEVVKLLPPTATR